MVSRKAYWAIKNGLSTQEKKLIAFYELEWFLRQKIPTVAEVAEHLGAPQTSVNYYLRRSQVVKALNNRGIPWTQHSQVNLTPEQIAAASLVMNFADTRSLDEKLDSLGVNPTQYQGWLKDPQFKNLIDSHAEQNLINIRPEAIAEFTKKIHQGDWQAIRYWFETTGELEQKNNFNPTDFMMMVIEILQRHIKSPEVLAAIANDMKRAATADKTLELVIQPEPANVNVENARKQLGV